MAHQSGRTVQGGLETGTEGGVGAEVTDMPNDLDENTLLLANDLPAELAPDKSFRRRVVFICLLVYVIIQVSGVILNPALQEIMESFICHKVFPDHAFDFRVADGRCKGRDIQKTLAMVRAWSAGGELLVRKSHRSHHSMNRQILT